MVSFGFSLPDGLIKARSRWVDDGDGPRCSGRASPEVILSLEAERRRWSDAWENAIEHDPELKAGVEYLRSPDNWDFMKRIDL